MKWRKSERLVALVIAVLLLVSSLSCSFLTSLFGDETPTAEPTEAPTEAPTEPATGEMVALDYPFGGIRLEYPSNWVQQYEQHTIILAESQAVVESMDWSAGAAMAIMSGRSEDIIPQVGVGEGSTSSEELLQAVLDSMDTGTSPQIETRRFASQVGAGAPLEVAESGQTVRGYVATYVDSDITAVILAIGPANGWDSVWPVMEAVMSSMIFYTPLESIDRGPIEVDRTETATLDPGGTDSWTYTASGEEYISVDVTALGNWDPTLEVFNPDDESIASNDDSGGSLNPSIGVLYLPAAGVYAIRVSAFSGNGDYEILVGAVTPGGGVIAYGETVEGELVEGAQDSWTFDAQAGDTVTISMIGQGSLTDTYLELYGPDGAELTRDDDGGDGLNALIRNYVLPATGTYRIVARAYSSGSGPYQLSLELGELTGTQMLTYGETVNGQLTDEAPQNYLAFEGTAGDVVSISMVGLGSLTDTYLELYGPDGSELISDDDSGEGFFALIESYTLPDSGIYTILARGFAGSTGPYELTLEQAAAEGLAIAYGQTLPGELTTDAPRQYWTFEGDSGDTVTLSMVGLGDLRDTYLELYGPDGTMLAQDDDSGEGWFALIEDFVLPQTGTYSVMCRGFAGSIGPYELTLTRQ